jgi:hypothetical protein
VRGFNALAVGAIALDLITDAAGHKEPLAVHKLVWKFIANNQDEDVRAELAENVRKASDNTLQLENLEAPDRLRNVATSLDMLRKVEETCNVEPNKRPTRTLTSQQIY